MSLFVEVVGWIVALAVVVFVIIFFLKFALSELIDMMDKFKGLKK